MPRAVAMLITAIPSAPDCDMKATCPSGGYAWANVPFMRTSGSVLITPMQFGPISRMPVARQISTSSCWQFAAVVVGLAEAGRDHDERP